MSKKYFHTLVPLFLSQDTKSNEGPIDGWLNKQNVVYYIFTVDYSAIRNNEILSTVVKWMGLEGIKVEANQTQK